MTWLLSLFLISAPFAGKLRDGWRGHPYGDASWLSAAPGDDCAKSADPDVAWACSEQIGDEKYTVNYLAGEGLYTGVGLECTGFAACSKLQDILVAAWGEPSERESYGPLPKLHWLDHGVAGLADFNQFSGKGTALALDVVLYKRQKAKRLEKAAGAADGL